MAPYCGGIGRLLRSVSKSRDKIAACQIWISQVGLSPFPNSHSHDRSLQKQKHNVWQAESFPDGRVTAMDLLESQATDLRYLTVAPAASMADALSIQSGWPNADTSPRQLGDDFARSGGSAQAGGNSAFSSTRPSSFSPDLDRGGSTPKRKPDQGDLGPKQQRSKRNRVSGAGFYWPIYFIGNPAFLFVSYLIFVLVFVLILFLPLRPSSLSRTLAPGPPIPPCSALFRPGQIQSC